MSKGSQQRYSQPLETSAYNWSSSNFLFEVCFYRTNSHFGYRIPRRMWIPKQFHFPEPSPEPITELPTYRLARTPTAMEYCLKSMSSETVRYGHHVQNDIHTPVPAIKCSLCKSSTPSKRPLANQIASESDNESGSVYESLMLDMSNISTFSSISSDATIWPDTVQAHGDHCANRFIVRIFTRTKWTLFSFQNFVRVGFLFILCACVVLCMMTDECRSHRFNLWILEFLYATSWLFFSFKWPLQYQTNQQMKHLHDEAFKRNFQFNINAG